MPKVAILSAVETVSPKIKSTLNAAAAGNMWAKQLELERTLREQLSTSEFDQKQTPPAMASDHAALSSLAALLVPWHTFPAALSVFLP